MLHNSRCYKCGGNTRLVSYRYNDGNPSWTCATCAEYGSGLMRRFDATHEVDAVATLRLPPVQRRGRRESGIKPRYAGPRARHDPMGY